MEEIRRRVDELAVNHSKLEGKLDMMMTNHLPHIQMAIDTVGKKLETVIDIQQDHSKKLVEFDLAKNILFSGIGLILVSVLAAIIKIVLK